jgi:hypothetical protein
MDYPNALQSFTLSSGERAVVGGIAALNFNPTIKK